MPRILFCCPVTVTPELGTAKVYLEASDGFRRLGWDVALAGPAEIAPHEWFRASSEARCRQLARFLAARAGEFDVVDFDHAYLPFLRADFPRQTLFVARSVLLSHLVHRASIPPRPGFRSWVAHLLLGRSRRRGMERAAAIATRTCAMADLCNLCNDSEAAELKSHGIAPEKMVVLPFGLTAARRAVLEGGDLMPPARPCVGFVGTFDPRKGMRDFPRLVAAMRRNVAEVRFKLVGTAGMLRTAEEVLAEFPRQIRSAIDVVPRFTPDELPGLLADCSVGVFPSAVEGFPFGVLEMLAVGLPVVAYRAPGPPMMLAEDDLVPLGDVAGMADRIAGHLRDRAKLLAAMRKARARSRAFDWDEIAARTAAVYEERLASLRGACSATQ